MVLTGKRRAYLTIQAATTTTDAQGGYTTAWADDHNTWGEAVPLSQSRTLEQGGIKYRLAVNFTIRKRTGFTLTPAHRIQWNSENYTIHSVVPTPKLDDQLVLAYV